MTVSTAHKALFDLTGKVALVTGSSSGLGRAMATALAGAGAEVVLAARRVEKLQEACDVIRQSSSSNVHAVQADLSCLDGVEALARTMQTANDHGPPDILINAAGVNFRQAYSDVSSDTWDATLDLNLKVPFFLSRALVPHMQQQNYGRIINVASLQSLRAMPDSIPYGASKGGVAQLTRAMAEAWSSDNICVNAIAPGFFPTELTQKVFDDAERAERLASQTAMGRNGRLEDIHGPVVFLSSPASGYITGQTLFCDGGFTAK